MPSRPPMHHLLALAAGALILLETAAAAPPHDPDRHLAALSQKLAANPGDHAARLERGRLYAQLGALDKGLADHLLVLRAAPGHGAARAGAARLYWLLGQPAAALAQADAALAHGVATAALHRVRGRALAELGRRPEASQAFAAALAAAETPGPADYLELADALCNLGPEGDGAALAVLAQGLVRLGPVVGLLDAAVAIDVRQGQRARALARLEPLRAIARDPRPWLERRERVLAQTATGDDADLPTAVAGPPPAPRAAGQAAPLPPVAMPTTVLIPQGAVWRYEDSGTNLGAGWVQPGYDDSGWGSGPAQLGFGDGDEATVVQGGPSGARWPTVYFRHEFTVPVGLPSDFARIRLLVDDGAVVWLNGEVVARSNIHNLGVGYGTLASATVTGAAESTFRTLALPPRTLRPGRNLLAVEVHQSTATSTDLSFDLELSIGLGAPTVVRGPYLQNGTPTGATVRWRTDQPTDTRLWLGTSPTTFQLAYAASTPTTEHIATLTGLQPETTYPYAVGNAAGMLQGPGPDYTLTTLPPIGATRPLRIWAFGDAGFGSRGQLLVRDQYLAAAAARPADAILMLGDNAYPDGTDLEYQNGLFDVYGDVMRRTFCWPTLGNHDAHSVNTAQQTGVYYGVFTLPTGGEAGGLPSGTEAYYSFDRGHVHFVCLDSMDSDRTAAGAMMTWLAADLAATTARWIVAYFHHPPYTFGSHDSDPAGSRMFDMRTVALPILEAGGVDLVLGGHSHSYERSFLVDGHYGQSATLQPHMILDRGDGAAGGDGTYAKPSTGPAPHEGAVYVVAGSAGTLGGGPLDHPVMYRSLNRLGSLVVDIDGDRLDARFLGVAGIEDEFTLVKGERRTLFRDQTGISVATGGRQDFQLDAGGQHAGRTYVLAGAMGTDPGFPFGAFHVPLNPDPWFHLSLQTANSAHYPNSFGVLDASGRATAALVLGPVPATSLIGMQLHHAFLVFDAGGVRHVSNAVRMTFRP